MRLSEFLELVDAEESTIIVLAGKDAIEAVKQDGYALRYVDKSIFDADGNTKKTQPCPKCHGT